MKDEKNMIYIITIVDTESTLYKTKRLSENKIENYIKDNLGGWNNLHSASTGGAKRRKKQYMMAGTTKDGSKAFSIICL